MSGQLCVWQLGSSWDARPPESQYRFDGVPVGDAGFGWYAGPAFGSRGGYMATNVSVVGGNRVCRPFLGAPTNGSSPHVFSAWVKSQDGTAIPGSSIQLSGKVHQFSLADPNDNYGSADYPVTTATMFTATASWQKVSVSWWPPNGSDGRQTVPNTFFASVVPGLTGKNLLVDEVAEAGLFTANPCGGFWSRNACFGGTNPPPPPPPPPPGAHFFQEGVATILELADSTDVDCLMLDGAGRAVLTTDKSRCLVVTPFLTATGFVLVLGDVESRFDGVECLLKDGNIGLFSGPCDGQPEFLVTDSPGLNQTTLQFPIRGLETSSNCLTRSGVNAIFLPCANPIGLNQMWYDKKSAPRTDPCLAWEQTDTLSTTEPLRTDLPSFLYNNGAASPTDYTVKATLEGARRAMYFLPGKRLRSKMLGRYLDSANDDSLSKSEISSVVQAGLGSSGSNIPGLLYADVLKSTLSANGLFATQSPPSVTARPNRDGLSRRGQPTDVGGEENMIPQPGWFRVVSPDDVNSDYPASAEDVYFGLGSFDLRIQGKMVGGFRCFNVYLYDYYAFSAKELTIPHTPYTDKDAAHLNYVGLAKNFHLKGKYVGCFISPGATQIRCPGIAKLR